MNEKRSRNSFMKMALSLAKRGEGKVNPNPMVGAVVAKSGKILGKGYHRFFGGPHAEVEALRQAGKHAQGADMFVTLEPCSHRGKTPPCTESIIEAGIKRVFVAIKDPNPLVKGRGIATLKRKGIEVQLGSCAAEAEDLNRAFLKYMRTKQAFVSLKMAITADGFIADSSGESKWITSEESRKQAHKLRAAHDAVLVGIDTVRKDNPSLNVRLKGRYRQPKRVIIDPRFQADPKMRIFVDDGGDVVIFSAKGRKKKGAFENVPFSPRIIESSQKPIPVSYVVSNLSRMGVTSILVEGGAGVFSHFMGKGIVDRLYIFMAGKLFGKGLSPFSGIPGLGVKSPISIHILKVRRLKGDILIEAIPGGGHPS